MAPPAHVLESHDACPVSADDAGGAAVHVVPRSLSPTRSARGVVPEMRMARVALTSNPWPRLWEIEQAGQREAWKLLKDRRLD